MDSFLDEEIIKAAHDHYEKAGWLNANDLDEWVETYMPSYSGFFSIHWFDCVDWAAAVKMAKERCVKQQAPMQA